MAGSREMDAGMSRDVTPRFKTEPKPKRTPFPRRFKGRSSAEWHRTRLWVFNRAQDRCEVRVDGCWKRATQAHHIHRRSQGGTDQPENLAAVCEACHTHIHANVAWAKEQGWLR